MAIKKKIVVKVSMCSEKKTRKALKIVVGISGVDSASLIGDDKDQIEVIGEGIDSVQLATMLRKGVGHTEIVTVGPVVEENSAAVGGMVVPYPYGYYNNNYGSPFYH
ncbi:hypothetical protein LXL04_037920 [Taraxacum kok-saghyz]